MAAAETDYLTKVGSPGTATTLAAPGHLIGGTSITVVSTTNWPTDTGVIFAMDTASIVNGEEVRDVGSYTEWEGIVAGATSITNMALRYGSDQDYPAGSTSRVYIPVASSRENRLVDGLLVEHKQTGKHSAITADSLVVADGGNIEADHILEAAAAHGVVIDSFAVKDGLVVGGAGTGVSNAGLDTTTGEPGGVWKDWTPTFTNMAGGTLTYAKYTQIGKTVHFKFKYTLAGAGISGSVDFTLPINMNADYVATSDSLVNAGWATPGTSFPAVIRWAAAGKATIFCLNAASAGAAGLLALSSTVPGVWANGHTVSISGTYEVA